MNMMGFRFQEMDECTWITADGRRVEVTNMELQHLIRTVRLLRRRETILRLVYLRHMDRYIANAPDGAAMACDMEANAICKKTPDEFLMMLVPPFRIMLHVLAARMS